MIEEALVEPGYSYIEHLGEYEGKEVFQLCYVVDEDGFVPKTGWPIYALFDPANPDRFWYKSDAGCELVGSCAQSLNQLPLSSHRVAKAPLFWGLWRLCTTCCSFAHVGLC